MGSRAAGVHDALGDALVVEVGQLLAHDEVFEQRGSPFACPQRVLVISNLDALVRAQGLARGIGAKGFELIELGVVVLAIDSVGTGELAVLRIFVVRHHGPRLSGCAEPRRNRAMRPNT